MKRNIKLMPLAVAGALMTAGAAHAEGFSFNGGYFRAGPGFGAGKGDDRTCYKDPGSEWKYRLGNECDQYGEFMFSYGAGKEGETQYNIYFMPNFDSGPFNDASSAGFGAAGTYAINVEQLYGEIKAPDFAPNTTFWAGGRFYGRQNGNQVDTFVVRMDGTGGGADIGLGGTMKLGVAVFRNDLKNGDYSSFGGSGSTGGSPGTRINLDLTGVPVGPGDTLRFTGTYTKGNFDATATTPKGTNGYAFSVQNKIDPFLGGQNFTWLQYASGSAYLNQNFAGALYGDTTLGSDVKHWRIADSLNWQVTPQFGGEAFGAYQEDKCGASCSATVNPLFQGTLKHFSLGVRPAFGFTQNFKLQGEVAFDSVKVGGGVVGPTGAAIGTENMTKLTIAPTVSFGSTYFSRPEVRLYVTTAKWNDSANAGFEVANNVTTGGYGGLGGTTSGTSYGIQVEAWW